MTVLQRYTDGVYADDSVINLIKKLDSIVFDCDGVLIDVKQSYYATINQTTKHILQTITGIDNPIKINFKIIEGFKSSGGFNDEVDLTYAVILSLVGAAKLKKNPAQFLFDVIRHSDSTGITSVEKYVQSLIDITDIQEKLSYPGIRQQNLLNQTFDQIFYGPELYTMLYDHTSPFSDSGLIEQDVVILNEFLTRYLSKKFGSKIAMVTGRGKKSTTHSLKSMLSGFDLKNSWFLEDESRELAKPNPESLVRCVSGMNSAFCLYVGDSMEDFIMAKEASKPGNTVIFCGIIGTSKNKQEKLDLFQKHGAVLVLNSIRDLTKILNLECLNTNGTMRFRKATITRNTKETGVCVSVNIDGTGKTRIKTGINFLDHLIVSFGKHGMMDLEVTAKSNDGIEHHLIEDTAITIGQTIDKALDTRTGITRFSYASVPMDESLAETSIDLVKRPFWKLTLDINRAKLENVSKEDLEHFFHSLLQNLNCCVHLAVRYGDNDHHKVEAAIKSLAVALRYASAMDKKQTGIPSTKGSM